MLALISQREREDTNWWVFCDFFFFLLNEKKKKIYIYIYIYTHKDHTNVHNFFHSAKVVNVSMIFVYFLI